MTDPAAPPTTVAIVPHTHWDREWYVPFQTFRVRLVHLLDRLLPLLEQDLSYRHFLLDGQTQVLDDYLEVRPEARTTLARLAAAGRVSVGPWMILMDEYMVSGETIVRDLQLGIARATELGGAMPVGYLPDMFGHVAQMPQILRLAGLEHAVVWRGVPRAIDRSAFWWAAPDGSTVRAEYLWDSYSNGRDLANDPTRLVERAQRYDCELGDARPEGGALLFMNGTDHQLPQPWLGGLVEAANALQDDYRFVVTSLPEYLAAQPSDDLPRWCGEMRSGARANVLMGVASNRVDVHRACAHAERALEHRAERLSTLLLPADRYPVRLLDHAWRLLVLNSAHDSSCACSHDEVVDAVTVRYEEARQIGDALVRDAVHALGETVDAPEASTIVVNPSPTERAGLIDVTITGPLPQHFVTLDDGTPCATQIVETLDGAHHRAVVAVPAVAGFGWRTLRAAPGPGPSAGVTSGVTPGVTADAHGLANERLRVQIDGTNGTWSVTTADGVTVAGLGRLVEGGDGGDTYNYSPPEHDVVVDAPCGVRVQVLEEGPVRARVAIEADYDWPAHAIGDERQCSRRSDDVVRSTVRTVLEVRTGERIVRVHSTIDHRVRDHRVRAHFPLPARVEGSDAECAFAVVHRGLTAEGGPHEPPLPTFVSRRFVDASDGTVGLALLHDGLLEYEVVDEGRELALTLVRATGYLSRAEPALRPNAAGPLDPLEGPQLQRRVVLDYAVLPHRGSWRDAQLHDAADAYLVALERGRGGGVDGAHLPPAGSALEVEGAVVSALYRAGGAPMLRAFDPGTDGARLRVASEGRPAAGWVVDLLGRPVERFDGERALRPFEIVTVRLD